MLFEDLCLKFNQLFKEQSEKFGEKFKRQREERLKNARERYKKAEIEYEEAMGMYKRGDVRYTKAYKKYTREFANLIKEETEYDRNEYALNIKFARLNLEPYQVFFFAQMLLIFLFIVFIFFDIITFFISHSIIATFVMIFLNVIIPFIIYLFIVNYPLMRARGLRIKMLGFMPEAISYMVMSLYLNPSLEHAVAFAGENTDEPLATDLKKILWSTYLREYDTVEDAFVAFAYDWGEWNDSFKRALYTLRTSTMRADERERRTTLDKASDIMMDGAKRDLIAYADALYVPTMIFFSVGVMLPLIFASILPLLPIGKDFLWLIVVVFDVITPFFFYLYARKIVEEKPILTTPPDLRVPLTKNERYLIIAIAVIVGAILFYFGLRKLDYVNSSLFFWALSIPFAIYLYATSYPAKTERDLIVNMNNDFPDALFNLGSRVAEGEPFESAMEKVVRLMRGSAVEILFRRILYALKTTRDSLEDILFGDKGILKEKSTKVINTSMKATLDAMKKDNVTAGNMIASIATHLRDMKGIEKDMQTRLRSATSMMELTSVYFAPITIAVTMVLYAVILGKLEQVSAVLPPTSVFSIGFLRVKHISAFSFSVIMIVYLFFTVMITGYFYTNIMYGKDRIQNRLEMAKMLIIAPLMYTISIYFINMFFAGFI